MNTNFRTVKVSILVAASVVISTAASAQSLDEIERHLLAQENPEGASTPVEVDVSEMDSPKQLSESTFVAEMQLKHSEMPVDMQELAMFTRWYLEGLSETQIANALRTWRQGGEK